MIQAIETQDTNRAIALQDLVKERTKRIMIGPQYKTLIYTQLMNISVTPTVTMIIAHPTDHARDTGC